ncbi:hypothetical protein BC629DRAFT_1546327 [Irpex lacteus]|nr:hypothetical protein BC629DRAFT_1546327 [Irpex lacteus]
MRASLSLPSPFFTFILLATSSSSFASASDNPTSNPTSNPNPNPNPNPRITWITPAGGDVYAPGSHLVGQWSVTDDTVVSPSFRLCNYLDGGSGSGASDKGGDEDGGEDDGDECDCYRAVPNVTSAYTFLLEMEDDSGSISASPAFTFTRQSPHSSYHNFYSDIITAGLIGALSSSLNNATSSSYTTSTGLSPAIVKPHHTVSPAAYAVPLCIAGAIIAIATTVGLHHRNKLARERSAQCEDLKSFKSQFTDNLGRLRGLSMWATGRSRAATRTAQKEKEDIDDIFTPVYLPPRSTTREPFCPRRNGSGGDVVKGGASARTPYPYQPSPGNRRHLEVVTEEEEVKVKGADGGAKSQYLETCTVVARVPTPLRPAYVRKSAPGVDN